MKVVVYVEGPSDDKVLEALLKPIIDRGRSHRATGFKLPLRRMERPPILNKAPARAADILKQSPGSWASPCPISIPWRLYDRTENQHRSFPQLVRNAPASSASSRSADKIDLPAGGAPGIFRVHCLKDLIPRHCSSRRPTSSGNCWPRPTHPLAPWPLFEPPRGGPERRQTAEVCRRPRCSVSIEGSLTSTSTPWTLWRSSRGRRSRPS